MCKIRINQFVCESDRSSVTPESFLVNPFSPTRQTSAKVQKPNKFTCVLDSDLGICIFMTFITHISYVYPLNSKVKGSRGMAKPRLKPE